MPRSPATPDDILECARNLLTLGGYNGFSYADIAETVGIRKASIHYHFPTKADLVRTLITRHRQQTRSALDQLQKHHAQAIDELRTYTQHWARCIEDASATFCICALLASEIPVLPAELVGEIRIYFEEMSQWIQSALERGVAQGSLHLTGPPKAEAEAFLATIHGALLSARAYGDPKVFSLITDPLIHRLEKKGASS